MKKSKLFRILAVAAICSLLMLAIPATPALAAITFTVSPDNGPPGTAITVTGSDFTDGVGGYVWFDIDSDYILDTGEPYLSATVSGGTLSAPGSITVPTEPRGTYPVRVEVPYVAGSPADASDTFTITPEIELDDTSGNVGDTIYVDGYGFNDGVTVTIYYDGVSVGTDATGSDGTFDNFVLTIPDSTKGIHKVKGKDASGYSPEVNFTVSPEITLDPTTGAVDDEVTVTGTGFAANSDITIYFGGDVVDITSGDDNTNSSGSFECIITIPDTTRGSHTIKAEDEVPNSDTATFTVAQKIAIDPAEGSSNITVTVTGTGFKANYTITITYDGEPVATSPTTVTTNPSGYFSATFTIPASMAGTYVVEATDGTNTATADFVSTTDATIDQVTTAAAPGHVGMELTITGTGFAPSATVTVIYATDPVTLATAPTDASGNFEVEITIPASLGGAHTITVSDGSISKAFDFYMELEEPLVPVLFLPLADEKAESEAVFDWGDVTDDSEPVTYDLQVATDATFSSTSIVVQKEGLTESEYTLLEAEKLESTGQDEPYYWRVRAVDAASNASGWSAASTFSVGFTFGFTGWVVYVTIAVVAVAFFFLGFWLGKRRSGFDEFA